MQFGFICLAEFMNGICIQVSDFGLSRVHSEIKSIETETFGTVSESFCNPMPYIQCDTVRTSNSYLSKLRQSCPSMSISCCDGRNLASRLCMKLLCTHLEAPQSLSTTERQRLPCLYWLVLNRGNFPGDPHAARIVMRGKAVSGC